jgi:cytochrome c oxidase cbb3-type subunit III
VCWLLAAGLPAPAQRMRGDEARSAADLPENNPLTSEADLGIGRQLFLGRCALCHGQDGEGGRGAALNTGQFRHGTSDREMFMTIRNGISNSEMPGTFLTDPEVWRLVAYVKRLGSARAPEEKASGDAQAGRAMYESQGCATCHRIEGSGGDLGPDLSAVGAQSSLRYLRDSIVNPSAYIALGYRSVTVTSVRGVKARGVHLNEDDYSIQLRDVDGNPRSFMKSELNEIRYESGSLMPPYRALSESDLDNLLAYLKSLKGKR